MADQKRWFKVWTSITSNGRFAEMSLEDIGRWTLLGAATALDGDSGNLDIPGSGKELCRILRVPDLEAAKVVLEHIFSVQFEESENRHGEFTVTWHNWVKYQEDSTQAQRAKASRSKRRGEEMRRDEKRREEIKERNRPSAAPVDKSKEEDRKEADEICKRLTHKDPRENYFQWAGAARKKQFEEQFIVAAALEYERVVDRGELIEKPWAYLDTIIGPIRTKLLQAEAERFKREDMREAQRELVRLVGK